MVEILVKVSQKQTGLKYAYLYAISKLKKVNKSSKSLSFIFLYSNIIFSQPLVLKNTYILE